MMLILREFDVIWDTVNVAKIQMKIFCQQYAHNLNKNITRSLTALEIGVVELQGLLESTGNRGHIEALKRKKPCTGLFVRHNSTRVLVCSWFKILKEMGAPSKLFFGLEKIYGQKRLILYMHCEQSQGSL